MSGEHRGRFPPTTYSMAPIATEDKMSRVALRRYDFCTTLAAVWESTATQNRGQREHFAATHMTRRACFRLQSHLFGSPLAQPRTAIEWMCLTLSLRCCGGLSATVSSRIHLHASIGMRPTATQRPTGHHGVLFPSRAHGGIGGISRLQAATAAWFDFFSCRLRCV